MQSVPSILGLYLDALAKDCVTAVVAAVQTQIFSLLSDMGLAGCADFRETRRGFGMVDTVENSTGEVKVSPVLSSQELLASIYENAGIVRVLSAQCSFCIAIRSCATLIVEKLAAQSCNCSPAVGRFIVEEEIQSMQCSKGEPCLPARLIRTASNLHTSEEYCPDSCSVRDDDRFLQGPDTNLIMSSKEVNAWIAAAKNKDDEEEDDDDDEEDDDDDEEDNDDDAEEGSGEEEEGDEEIEGDAGEEDEEGGEEDDDEGEEGEEGEDGEENVEEVGEEEEDEDGVEGEEEEDGGGDDDDGYDDEEGEDDEDEEDEDEEDKDETSEPPKKKRK